MPLLATSLFHNVCAAATEAEGQRKREEAAQHKKVKQAKHADVVLAHAQRATAKLFEQRVSRERAINSLLKDECWALLELGGRLDSLGLEGKKAATKVGALRQCVASALAPNQAALLKLVGKYWPTLVPPEQPAAAAVQAPAVAPAVEPEAVAAAPASAV